MVLSIYPGSRLVFVLFKAIERLKCYFLLLIRYIQLIMCNKNVWMCFLFFHGMSLSIYKTRRVIFLLRGQSSFPSKIIIFIFGLE